MFHRHKEARLLAERHQHDEAELRQLVQGLEDSDGVIGPEGFRQFVEHVTSHGIDLASVPEIAKDVRLAMAQGGFFMETETTLILKKDEAAVLDLPVRLLKEVKDREFRGGSQGVSIPIGGGVRYRVGAVRGHMVTIGSHWETADEGQLTVTDQRVVYHGGRKTPEFPYSKLATINVYSDAIDVGVTSRQNTSSFSTHNADLIAGFIHGAVAHQDPGITIIKASFQD